MKCRAARQSIGRFIDGSLPDKVCKHFLTHIADCAECRYLLLQTKRSLQSLRHSSLRDITVPDSLSCRIKDACRRAEDDRRIIATSTAPAIGSPAFVATCASLVMGAIMFYVVTTQVYMPGLDRDGGDAQASLTTSASPEEMAPSTPSEPAVAPAFQLLAASAAPQQAPAAPTAHTPPQPLPIVSAPTTPTHSRAVVARATPRPVRKDWVSGSLRVTALSIRSSASDRDADLRTVPERPCFAFAARPTDGPVARVPFTHPLDASGQSAPSGADGGAGASALAHEAPEADASLAAERIMPVTPQFMAVSGAAPAVVMPADAAADR